MHFHLPNFLVASSIFQRSVSNFKNPHRLLQVRGDASNSTSTDSAGPLVNIIQWCTEPGTFAMTFDDGPVYGSEIASVFDNNSAKATFFVNGNNYNCIYDYADDIKTRYAAGHQIAAHTWSHTDIVTLNATEFNLEMSLLETALVKITGVKPAYFRPPYGSYTNETLDILTERGYKSIGWNSYSGDTLYNTSSKSIASYNSYYNMTNYNEATEGIIGVNHESIAATARKVVSTVVPKLVAAGWRLITVAECLNDPNPYQVVGTPSERDATWTCEGTPVGPKHPTRKI
ncbi:glycoside hydrolase/deacetylase [Meredithblackwellia eburnea MCA 4105]